jgi:sugar lactone lactonase YvrE
MRIEQSYRRHLRVNSGSGRLWTNTSRTVRQALARAKQAVLYEYAPRVGENVRLLRLALNEAEALAWQTDFPHLFFPALAAEKAETAASWHQRQRALRRSEGEVAFAE